MSNTTSILLYCGVSLWLYMTCWFLLSVRIKRNDIADIAWGLGFVLLATISYLKSVHTSGLSLLLVFFITIWGGRLAWHISTRMQHKKEDFRYASWRSSWGRLFILKSYLRIYMLQGVLLYIVSLPVILTIGVSSKISVLPWTFAGILLWTTGMYFEIVGDWQLHNFVRNKPSKDAVMNKGLWRYTRHPNYFGEVTLWWGVWLICISTDIPIEYKFMSVLGPITITLLILFVSGIPLLEKKYATNSNYQKYAKRTSRFIPRNPRVH